LRNHNDRLSLGTPAMQLHLLCAISAPPCHINDSRLKVSLHGNLGRESVDLEWDPVVANIAQDECRVGSASEHAMDLAQSQVQIVKVCMKHTRDTRISAIFLDEARNPCQFGSNSQRFLINL